MSETSRNRRINEIFLAACDLAETELADYLDQACEDDPEIRSAVEKLLNADNELESNEQALPAPPMKDLLRDMQEAGDVSDFRYLKETRDLAIDCEQCGAKLNVVSSDEPALCPTCGGATWTANLLDAAEYSDRFRLPPRFQVKSKLGEGSFGVVSKAWDSRLDRDVAIKIPKSEMVSRKLFVREARAASRLKNDNIVVIHDVNDSDDFAFIVSDFIDGISLNRWRKEQNLSIREACKLTITITLAMEHAHGRGVIHRDLKPSNIVMDKSGQPHVLDFGLSKSRTIPDGSIVKPGTPFGTPAFMPPEQVIGNAGQIDERSDVYSLGVILYQLLTGFLPFSGEEIFDSICNDAPKSIQSINSKLPLALNAIVMKALAKDPQNRYPSAQAFADDLQRFIDGRIVHEYPRIDSRVMLATTRRWSIMAVVCVLSLLAIGLTYDAWTKYRANNPLTRVVVEASVPNVQFRWCRYDEMTGKIDVENSEVGRSGKPINLPPGFYKVYASNDEIASEVFRTVPGPDDNVLHIVGVNLKHRAWERDRSTLLLPKIEMRAFPDKANAIRVTGGKLVTLNDKSVLPYFRNIRIEIPSFWITNSEFGIEEVRKVFPKMQEEELNFEIVAAYAENVGASIPSVEEYLFLDQQNIQLDGLTTGLKEWTESALPNLQIDDGFLQLSKPADLNQRMVLQTIESIQELNMEFKSIKHANFFSPISAQEFEPNSGFRLIWRN